jgi:hypothetical protein
MDQNLLNIVMLIKYNDVNYICVSHTAKEERKDENTLMCIEFLTCEVTHHAGIVSVMTQIHVAILKQPAVNLNCLLNNLKYRSNPQ